MSKMMRLFDSLVLILFFFGATVAGNCLDGVSLTTWPARAQVIFQNASESCSVEVVFNEQARKHGTVKPGTNLVEVNLDFQTYHNLSSKSFRVAFENCDKSFRCYFYHVFSMTELQWRCMQPRYRTVVGDPQYLKILDSICKNLSTTDLEFQPKLCSRTCDWLLEHSSFNCSEVVDIDDTCSYEEVYGELQADEFIFDDMASPPNEMVDDCLSWTDSRLMVERDKQLLPLVDNNHCFRLWSGERWFCFSRRANRFRQCHYLVKNLIQEQSMLRNLPREEKLSVLSFLLHQSDDGSSYKITKIGGVTVVIAVLLLIIVISACTLAFVKLRAKSNRSSDDYQSNRGWRRDGVVDLHNQNVVVMHRIHQPSCSNVGNTYNEIYCSLSSVNNNYRSRLCSNAVSDRTVSTYVGLDYALLGPNFEFAADKVVQLRQLESGEYGKVSLAIITTTGEHVAVKMAATNFSCLSTSLECREAEAKLRKEAQIMHPLRHPNIAKLVGVVSTSRTAPFQILIEYLSWGNLNSFLRQKQRDNEPLSLYRLHSFSQQIWNGMNYLSERLIVHRDLATRNCLLENAVTVKMGDFGFAEQLESLDDFIQVNDDSDLPLRWLPPEMLSEVKYYLKSDVWQFGVVMWEIYSLGMKPYCGISNRDVIQYVLDGKVLPKMEPKQDPDGLGPNLKTRDYPDAIYKFMKKCWKFNVADRPSFGDYAAAEELFNLVDVITQFCSYQNVELF